MNELQLLRRSSDDVATVSDESLARGRAALFGAIEEETNVDASATARAARRRRRRRGWGFGTLGGAVAVSAVATLVMADVVGLAGWRGGATPAAAAVLEEAALAAIEVSDPVVGPGQYLKIETTAVYGSTTQLDGQAPLSWLTIADDQLFVPADRSDEWVWVREHSRPYEAFSDEGRRLAEESYQGTIMEFGSEPERLRATGGNFYSYPSEVAELQLDELPRDPHRLLNHIYRVTLGAGPSPDGEALVYIADRLRSGAVPADLRGAFYQAAALIPGVEIIEDQATLNGRTGVAIGRTESSNQTRQELIIDADTGLFIGERQIQLAEQWGYPAGTATAWTTVVTSVSDEAPEGGTPNGFNDVMGCELVGPGAFQCPVDGK
ncbi:CU044_5270 family protein [Agromyces italicus]|uniref:CU044_5270 family protein n=1 Tax=Agromyces italicus TaxID=279572 RepID=UPI0003B43356|nr:CU044_5270 family protein [Agromyces italicus]